MKWMIVALALVVSGCALPSSQAKMRQQVASEFQPRQAYDALVAFHAAVLQTEGIEREHLAILVAWIARGVETLRLQPDQWEATARERWPVVRSLIGPYDGLQPFAAQFDTLLQ